MRVGSKVLAAVVIHVTDVWYVVACRSIDKFLSNLGTSLSDNRATKQKVLPERCSLCLGILYVEDPRNMFNIFGNIENNFSPLE
jgi:hypothetical protein